MDGGVAAYCGIAVLCHLYYTTDSDMEQMDYMEIHDAISFLINIGTWLGIMRRMATLSFLVAVVGLCVLLALLAAGFDQASGLWRSGGTLIHLVDSDGHGFSLLLQETSDKAWGFFELPERRLYGFVSFAGKEGKVRKGLVNSGTAKGSTLELEERKPGGPVLLGFSGPDLPQGETTLVRSADGGLPLLKSFTKRGGRLFRLDLLANPVDQSYPFLDARLRRGKSPPAYARELMARTRRTQGLEERQYWLWCGKERISIATERCLSGANERGESFFGFMTVDAATGKEIDESDLFLPGWREALSPLICREAARVLKLGSGRDGSGGTETSPGLRSYGLFDETIAPSSSFFLCESGIGFHYDRYELGPYSLGDFTFILPWNDVAGLLEK
ncbi:MAG: RsiV family protein [Spirochaetes bacterium]|nr:RsiV family protein [Spirochaetota bacterium]